MHDSVILVSKLFLAAAGALACIAIWRSSAVQRISNRQFVLFAVVLAMVGRAGFLHDGLCVSRAAGAARRAQVLFPEAMKVLAA